MILAALLFAAALGAAPAAVPAPGPVAVMPFKNLNADASLDFLALGIAETMVSDLRKGSLAVVERDQVERAIREADRASAAPAEEADRAVKVGTLVGAKTIVIGSFQKADNQVRINARFVLVETGVVLDAAKATGRLADVFSLQDEIVARLTGRAPAKRAGGAKTVEAYRIYAGSLSLGDSARAAALKKSIAIDPSFRYAADDLAALQKRMEGFRAVARSKAEERAAAQIVALRAAVDDKKLPAKDRSLKAVELLTTLQTSDRWQSLLDAARHVRALGLPPWETMDITAYATAEMCLAHTMLNQGDLALQVCEFYAKNYPDGPYFELVDHQIELVIESKKAEEAGRKKAELELEDLKARRAGANVDGDPVAAAGYELEVCAVQWNNLQNDATILECGRFIARYREATDPKLKEFVGHALFTVASAHRRVGEFSQARAVALELQARDPELARSLDVGDFVAGLPQE